MDDQDGDLIDLLDLSQQLRELDDPLEHGSRHRERTLRHAPILILIFIFIAGLGDAVEAIPMLQVWRFFTCQDAESNHTLRSHSPKANDFAESPLCQTEYVSRKVATLDGWVNAVGMLLAVGTGLFYGRLSDVKGRLPILKFCAWGSLISQIITLGALWFWQYTDVGGIICAEIILGVSGGGPVLVSTCYAILTDVLDEGARLTWFARSVGVWYASRIVGPLIGSWLLKIQLLAPIYFATILFGLSIPVLYYIPETKQRQAQSSVQPIDYLSEMKIALSAMSFCTRNRNLVIISCANMSYYFGVQVISILTIYVNTTYGWSIGNAGYLASYQAALKCLVAMLVVPYAQEMIRKRWTVDDREFDLNMAQISFVIDALSWMLVAMLPASGLLPSLALGTLGIAASSSMRSLAVAEISSEDHGRLFACLGVVDALGAAIASPVLANVYGFTMSTAPETVFLLVAIVFGSSCVLFHWYSIDRCMAPQSNYHRF